MTEIAAFLHEFDRHRLLIERAVETLTDEQFFQRPAEHVNSIALIVKHLSGNLSSRWSDFLNSDGDKPWRDRDQEFVETVHDGRAALMTAWREAWQIVTNTVSSLTTSDLVRQVTIRGEPHTVFQALIRGVDHAAYHTGQILYLARLIRPEAPWLTIAPGMSKEHRAGYLQKPQTPAE